MDISLADRGTARRVRIGESPADSDDDGLPDDWEQQIIDADETDDITALAHVNPGDDFDGDGESNLAEYDNGTDPTDPLSTTRGDVDGDKYLTLGDVILALQTACGMDTGSAIVSADGDIDGDNRIGLPEAAHDLRSLSGIARAAAQESTLVQSSMMRDASPEVPVAEIDELVAGNSAFAMNMYQAIKDSNENIFYSPYSVSLAQTPNTRWQTHLNLHCPRIGFIRHSMPWTSFLRAGAKVLRAVMDRDSG